MILLFLPSLILNQFAIHWQAAKRSKNKNKLLELINIIIQQYYLLNMYTNNQLRQLCTCN